MGGRDAEAIGILMAEVRHCRELTFRADQFEVVEVKIGDRAQLLNTLDMIEGRRGLSLGCDAWADTTAAHGRLGANPAGAAGMKTLGPASERVRPAALGSVSTASGTSTVVAKPAFDGACRRGQAVETEI